MEKKPLMLMLLLTSRDWKDYMRKLALEAGIPDSYRMIIMYLARNPGAGQKELAADGQKTDAAISQTVKEMQLSGYLTKETSPEDQRCVRLYLTEKGLASANRVREKIHEADRMITDVISPEKEKALMETLELLRETIRKEL